MPWVFWSQTNDIPPYNFFYERDWETTKEQLIGGAIHEEKSKMTFKLKLRNLQDYVYFDTLSLPQQSADQIQFVGSGSTTVQGTNAGTITISSTGGGSPTGFTEKDNSVNPQDDIAWDITTDGPNLIVTTGSGVKNALVISS